MQIPYIFIAVGVLLLLFLIVAIIMQRKKPRPTDYYSLFVIGLIWTIFGAGMYVINKDYSLGGLFAIGIVFLIAGLANKEKWEKNRVRWKDLSESEKQFKIIVIALLALLLIAGLVAYFLFNQ